MAMLNRRIIQEGYQGGNVVHHCDEAGRPGVDDIDSFIAFVPKLKDPYFVDEKDADGFKQFRAVSTRLGFQAVFNAGWLRKLDLGLEMGPVMRTPQGASEVGARRPARRCKPAVETLQLDAHGRPV